MPNAVSGHHFVLVSLHLVAVFWLWRCYKGTCFIHRTYVCAKQTTDVTFSACGISKLVQRSHLAAPSLQNPTVKTRWSHLQPWPRSGIVPLPHPAGPCHPRPHRHRHPLLPPYLPWPHTCPFQPCTGCWRMARGHRRRGLAALRLHRTPSAGWWVSSGWDTGSSSPDSWRWENGDWNWKFISIKCCKEQEFLPFVWQSPAYAAYDSSTVIPNVEPNTWLLTALLIPEKVFVTLHLYTTRWWHWFECLYFFQAGFSLRSLLPLIYLFSFSGTKSTSL